MSMTPKTYTREVIGDGTKTLQLLDSDRVTVLATRTGLEAKRTKHSKALWSHETYALLKQLGRA